jgi:hypothetical protein
VSIGAKNEWFTFFIADASTAQATLALISLNQDLEKGWLASTRTLRYKAAAMHKAQGFIEQGSRSNLHALMGTVATLLLTEVSLESIQRYVSAYANLCDQSLEINRRNAASHMHGLKQLIVLSGGMQSIACNEPLLNVIGWCGPHSCNL